MESRKRNARERLRKKQKRSCVKTILGKSSATAKRAAEIEYKKADMRDALAEEKTYYRTRFFYQDEAAVIECVTKVVKAQGERVERVLCNVLRVDGSSRYVSVAIWKAETVDALESKMTKEIERLRVDLFSGPVSSVWLRLDRDGNLFQKRILEKSVAVDIVSVARA